MRQVGPYRTVFAAVSALDNMLSHGHFSGADRFLERAPVEDMDPSVLLGMLSLTFWGKERIWGRPAFLIRAEARMIEVLGEERTLKLLENRR